MCKNINFLQRRLREVITTNNQPSLIYVYKMCYFVFVPFTRSWWLAICEISVVIFLCLLFLHPLTPETKSKLKAHFSLKNVNLIVLICECS